MRNQRFTLLFILSILFYPIILNAQWTSVPMESELGQSFGAATESKLFLPGGVNNFGYVEDVVVYNVGEGAWSSMPLEEGRAKIATVISGDKLFCAGGIVFATQKESDLVEIYDVNTYELVEVAYLSQPRVELSAVAVGDKVLFAGGMDVTSTALVTSDVVDIYDTTNGTWSQANLSQARCGMAHAALDGKAYFAGGFVDDDIVSDVVDVYDSATDTWSVETLSQARALYGGGIDFDGKVYFAGGIMEGDIISDVIDIYEPATNTWTTASLLVPRYGIQAGRTSNYVLFAAGGDQGSLNLWYYTNTSGMVDIYNKLDDVWEAHVLTNDRCNHSTLSASNQVYVVAGYEISSGTLLSGMDVFTEVVTDNDEVNLQSPGLKIYPNPVTDNLVIESFNLTERRFALVNALGKTILEDKLNDTFETIDVANIPEGVYFLMEYSKDGKELQSTSKFVKSK